MGKDLGTYHLKVEFENGDGYIQTWETGARYTLGTRDWQPLVSLRIEPTWTDEEDLFSTMEFIYTDGSYSCDCNKGDFLARSKQQSDPDLKCGNTLKLKRLTAIRPSGEEKIIWEGSPESELM